MSTDAVNDEQAIFSRREALAKLCHKLALVFAVPRTSTVDILERGVRIDSEPLRNLLKPLRSKRSLGICACSQRTGQGRTFGGSYRCMPHDPHHLLTPWEAVQ